MRPHTPVPEEPMTWVADRALGIELEAVDVEAAIEWAEQQGRSGDVRRLSRRLASVLDELATVTEEAEEHTSVHIDARRAAEAAAA